MYKFFIVIPTRNRHDTLYYSIKSALAQDYSNLQIIVSDNNSSRETKEIVDSFQDSRLVYQRSERSLSMVNSWEFAMSAVEGEGFVHFMGDDNGLLPDACSFALKILQEHDARVLLANPAQYIWPSKDCSCYLKIPRRTRTVLVSSLNALRLSYMLAIGFARLPTINCSFIHTSVIDKVRSETNGKYFVACNPDVYSAVMNAAVVESYLLTNYPFVVNGASRHSNGASADSVSAVSQFTIDNLNDGYEYHHSFPASSSYYLNVYEAYAYALQTNAVQKTFVHLNYQHLLNKLVSDEYFRMGRTWLAGAIRDFAKINNLSLPDLTKAKETNSDAWVERAKFFAISKNNFEISNLASLVPEVHQAGLVAKELLSIKAQRKEISFSLRDMKDYIVESILQKNWLFGIGSLLIQWLSGSKPPR